MILNSTDEELRGFGYNDEQIEQVHQMRMERELEDLKEIEEEKKKVTDELRGFGIHSDEEVFAELDRLESYIT